MNIIGVILLLLTSSIFSTVLAAEGGGDELIFYVIPESVWEGQDFSVLLRGGDVEGIMVTLWQQESPVSTNYTDQYGLAYLTAPFVSMDEVLLLTAQRSADEGVYDATANLNVKDGADHLVMLIPDSVEENEEFTVTVTANEKYDVKDAAVSPDWTTQIYYTNAAGEVVLIAPEVDQNKSYTVYANKEGYLYDGERILIINTDIIVVPQLVFEEAPSSIPENTEFQVKITNGLSGVASVRITAEWGGTPVYTNQQGWATLTSPEVTETRSYTLQANKTGYLDATFEITVQDVPLPALAIAAPSSVSEGQPLTVTVTANNIPVAAVHVLFIGVDHVTNEDGKVTLIAPVVNQDTSYPLNAIKTGYQSATANILVLDIQETEPDYNGGLYGRVTDTYGAPIVLADICVILEDVNNVMTSSCTLTYEDGTYLLSVPPGTYDVRVEKQGYITRAVPGVVISSYATTELNVILEKEDTSSIEENNTQKFINDAIRKEISDGNVGSLIDVDLIATEVFQYSSDFSVSHFITTTTAISFDVETSGGSGISIIALRIGDIIDLSQSSITVNGDQIMESEYVPEFFDIQNNQNTACIKLSTDVDSYIFIRVPYTTDSATINIQGAALPVEEVLSLTTGMIAFGAIIIILVAAVVMFRRNEKT
jgi:hypothetical protein